MQEAPPAPARPVLPLPDGKPVPQPWPPPRDRGSPSASKTPGVLQALEQPQKVCPARRIEHRGRLVGDQQPGRHRQSPCQTEPLHLPAREMGNPPVPEIISPREAHLPQSGARPRLTVGKTRQISRLTDRLTGRKGRIQCRFTVLKDHLKPAFRPVEGREIGGSPSKRISPASGERKPARIEARVVFPEPEAPISATVSPLCTRSETSCSTVCPPNCFPIPLPSRRVTMPPRWQQTRRPGSPGALQQRRRLLPAESG